jgi:hypothetical protein
MPVLGVSRRREKKERLRRDAPLGNAPSEKIKPCQTKVWRSQKTCRTKVRRSQEFPGVPLSVFFVAPGKWYNSSVI